MYPIQWHACDAMTSSESKSKQYISEMRGKTKNTFFFLYNIYKWSQRHVQNPGRATACIYVFPPSRHARRRAANVKSRLHCNMSQNLTQISEIPWLSTLTQNRPSLRTTSAASSMVRHGDTCCQVQSLQTEAPYLASLSRSAATVGAHMGFPFVF